MTISICKFQTCLPVGKVSNSGLLLVFLLIMCLSPFVTAVSAAKWGGVDESVVEKYADEYGREAREPLINTDRGDLLLFVFLLAGAVGGFAAGYYWRQLTESQNKGDKKKGKSQVVESSSK
jgi:ABC-type cobalt transport system substrate-binding protein